MDSHLQDGGFALLAHHAFNFLLRFFHHFLDSRRMDPSVNDQTFQSDPRNFSSHRVKAGQYNRLRGIVDDQLNSGHRLQGTNIPALSANDAALHLIAWELYYGNGRLRHMIGRTSLNGSHHVLLRFLFRFFLCLALQLLDQLCSIMLHIFFHRFQKIFLRLLGGQTGNFFQLFLFLGIQGFHFSRALPQDLFLGCQAGFLAFHRLRLFIQVFLLA